MMSMPYFNDPEYIRFARVEDLASPFTPVLRNDHFRWTLTPLEGRSLFINEHIYTPDMSAINRYYDLYQPDFVHLFVHEEVHVLRYLLREYQAEKESLDRIRDEVDLLSCG